MSDRSFHLAFVFLIPILFTVSFPHSAGDLSVWIAHGEFFLRTGQVLRNDVFSVLSTHELVYPCFSLCVIYALLHRTLGLVGTCLFHDIAVLSALLWILYRPLIRDRILPGGKNLKWFLFAFWLGGCATFAERPSMVALIPMVLSFQIISRLNQRINRNDVLKLLMLGFVWANLHGSFILLPMMLAWRFCFGFRKLQWSLREIGLLACSLAVPLLNPFGWRIYPYLLETATFSKERGISEWQPTWITAQLPVGILFWTLFLTALAYCSHSYREGKLQERLSQPFFLFLILGASSIRNAALSFVVLLPAAHVLGILRPGPTDHREQVRPPWANATLASVLVLAVVFTLYFRPTRWDETAAFRLADRIRADGRTCSIFNPWELGSFLMLELPNPIYLDTRNIIYSREDFNTYKKTLAGDAEWMPFLERGKACFAIVDAQAGAGLLKRLSAAPQWEFLEKEGEYSLFAIRR